MGWVLYHVKRFWMIRVSGLHFSPHLRSPWLTGELTRPANVRLENESQSGPQVDRSFLKYNSTKVFNFQQSRKKKRQAGYYSFYQLDDTELVLSICANRGIIVISWPFWELFFMHGYRLLP